MGVHKYISGNDYGAPALDIDFTQTGGTIRLVYVKYRLQNGTDYVGEKMVFGTDDVGLAGLGDTGDSDPSSLGVVEMTKTGLAHLIASGDHRLFLKLEGNQPSPVTGDDTIIIEGIGFAGDGADPLSP